MICGKATLELPTPEAARSVSPTVERRRGASVAPQIPVRRRSPHRFDFPRQIGTWTP